MGRSGDPRKREPQANGVDLAALRARREAEDAFAQLNETWAAKALEAETAGLPSAALLLTARFEVLTGILASALGQDASDLMRTIEIAALPRAIQRVNTTLAQLAAVSDAEIIGQADDAVTDPAVISDQLAAAWNPVDPTPED